ncbi:MAG: anthranilate synthase component I family protein [Thermodesulfovibrionales bacterium]|jgi:anthranilate/para-aminobenzoate synthase component I
MNKTDFLSAVESGSIPPLSCEIPYREPYEVYELLACQPPSILLESVKGPEKIARYSFIAWEPYLRFMVKDGEVLVGRGKGKDTISFRPPLERLQELVAAYPQRPDPQLPPFQGGAVGLLCYDFVRYIERIPSAALDDLQIPQAHFIMADRVIAFDHLMKRSWIILCPGARETELGFRDISHIDWAKAYDEAVETLEKIGSRVQGQGSSKDNTSSFPAPSLAPGPRPPDPLLCHEMTKEKYMTMVERAKEYIAAGDIFQANLSQRISADIGETSPWRVYTVLRSINPSPFAAYADFGGYQIVSSSPERLIRVAEGIIDTRPIAGTRPRGKDRGEDAAMRSELLLNEKERAEHIMLIDLERNDMGRVCDYGSVEVDELMITEDYSHVIHIVSNVKGRLREGKTAFDAIRATFPGGTITGVPKVRCMEIIDELEPVARGPYTGSLGYISFGGAMDLNIIIRTFVIKDGRAYVQAGAGIVADSDPEREYYETLKKAEALLKTLGRLGG